MIRKSIANKLLDELEEQGLDVYCDMQDWKFKGYLSGGFYARPEIEFLFAETICSLSENPRVVIERVRVTPEGVRAGWLQCDFSIDCQTNKDRAADPRAYLTGRDREICFKVERGTQDMIDECFNTVSVNGCSQKQTDSRRTVVSA